MNKRMLRTVIPISLVVALAVGVPMLSGCLPGPAAPEPAAPAAPEPAAPAAPEPAAPAPEVGPWVLGYIGAFDTDVGKSALRGTDIAVEEINAAGGLLGRPIVVVRADSAEDTLEGIKAMEYLNEVAKVDFMVSGSVDDVTLAWMPRVAEYKVPLMETWTSAIRAIELVHNEYDDYKSYFMDHMNDYDQGAEYVAFAADILAAEKGWDEVVIFYEDTAYGGGVAEYVRDEIAPGAGIEVIGEVMYDIDTKDFAPVFAQIEDYNPDFIFHISSVNCVPPSAAYIELEVPLPITGVNVAAASAEFWSDMGGMAGGFSSISPPPAIGMDFDPPTQAFIDKYQAKYASRPIFPHFNGFNAYWGVYMMVWAAERAGGFEPLDAWVTEMEKTDFILWRYGGFERNDTLSPTGEDIIWQYYKFYGPDHDYTHSQVLDTTGENGRPGGVVMQWGLEEQTPVQETVRIIHPPRWRNGDYVLPAHLQ